MIFRHGRSINQIHLELTTNCNLACPQCARTDGDLPNPRLVHNELTLADIQRLLPPEDVANLRHIYACGNFGDPVIARDVVEIFKYFRSHNPGLVLGIHTNGSLRNEAWWRRLPEAMGEWHYVVFPLDGLEDTHHIYRRNTNWSKLIANIKAFIDGGGKALCDTLVFKHNAHQLDEITAFAKSLGFIRQNVRVSGRQVPPSVSWLEIIDPEDDYSKNSGVIKCTAMQNGGNIFLGADGVFHPCCFIGSAHYTRRYKNIEGYTIQELQNMPLNPTAQICKDACGVQKDNKTMCEAQVVEERRFKN